MNPATAEFSFFMDRGYPVAIPHVAKMKFLLSVRKQTRAEHGNALAARTPTAFINNAVRAVFTERLRQMLTDSIVVIVVDKRLCRFLSP